MEAPAKRNPWEPPFSLITFIRQAFVNVAIPSSNMFARTWKKNLQIKVKIPPLPYRRIQCIFHYGTFFFDLSSIIGYGLRRKRHCRSHANYIRILMRVRKTEYYMYAVWGMGVVLPVP